MVTVGCPGNPSESMPDVWFRIQRVIKANNALKCLGRQDPSHNLDILKISERRDTCYYTWDEIVLIENIINNMTKSTVTCPLKKCAYHAVRFP